jgi:hypothetical protein
MSSRGVGGLPRVDFRALQYSIAKERRVGRLSLRAGTDRGPSHALGGNARLCTPPLSPQYVRASSSKHTHTMSEAKFNKAVEIVQSLPKEGPIQPTQDDQLYVRTPIFFSPPYLSQTRSFTVTTSKVCDARRNRTGGTSLYI